MSAGTIHVKSSIILSASFAVLGLVGYPTLPSALGALVGTFITPDLDVDNGFVGDNIIKKRFGNLGKKIWKWFWKPYKDSFKHGKFASHFPVFSTAIRLLYIYFFAITIPHLVFWALVVPNWSLEYALQFYAVRLFHPYFFLGLAYSDTIHYTLDVLTTNSKLTVGGRLQKNIRRLRRWYIKRHNSQKHR